MRLLAFIALLIALAAAGGAGHALWREWQAPVALALPEGPAATPAAPAPTAPRQPRHWPALFGEKQPPAPPQPAPEPPAPAPAPPAPSMPPLSALGYELKGVVRAVGTVWALVSHPAGDRILRVGDALEMGLVVTAVTEEGIWIGMEGREPQLLGYPE